MKTFSMNDVRTNVAARIEAIDGSVLPDILDVDKLHDNIVRALDVITAPPAKGGHARKVLVTSAHSNHHDDGALGPHGHNPHGGAGWAVDFVPSGDPALQDRDATLELLRELIAQNPYVTKVGCPATYATLPQLVSVCRCPTARSYSLTRARAPHIHIQSA